MISDSSGYRLRVVIRVLGGKQISGPSSKLAVYLVRTLQVSGTGSQEGSLETKGCGARLCTTVLYGVNLFMSAAALLLAQRAEKEAESGAFFFLELHSAGVKIWETCFGFHLVVLGALMYRGGFVPSALGALLALAGVG